MKILILKVEISDSKCRNLTQKASPHQILKTIRLYSKLLKKIYGIHLGTLIKKNIKWAN